MRLVMITTFSVMSKLVSLAIAKPVPNWKAGGMAIPLTRHSSYPNSSTSIDLEAIGSHVISVREKILCGLDNYEMNTGSMHPFAVRRTESGLKTRGASIPVTNYQNEVWIGEISVGTPPKTLKVQIDTGSADMWVLKTGCRGISADRNLWYPESSESAKSQGIYFLLEYSDGTTVKGDRYVDNVTIAGFTADPQTFGAAISYASENDEPPADGLLGLAFPSLSDLRTSTLFESLIRQKKLLNPTFSLKLSSCGAEMYVGGANNMLYSGDIAYTRVTVPAMWQVSMDSILVNGNKILENIPAIFDTGANYIYGDWERVSELYRHLDATLVENAGRGLGYYYLPCTSFPTVSLTFGGRPFEIPPEVLRLVPIEEGSAECFGAIIALRAPVAYWNIGMTFLQGVYTVFDYTAPRVGLADLA